MIDEETVVQEVVEETTQPEPIQETPAEAQQESTETNEVEETVVVQEKKKKDTTELNLRQLREKADKAEREKEEIFQKMQEFEKAFKAQQPAEQKPQQKEPDYTINPDDLVEGKHLSKYDRKIDELEKKIAGYQQQTAQSTMETQLKAQYPDFEKVVNNQTIADLKFADPDLAASIGSNPDMLSKARSAYTAIKRLGIYQEDVSSVDRALAAANSSKPKPLASVSPQQGDSPLSKANAFANGLTDDLKKNLWKEMEDARKNL